MQCKCGGKTKLHETKHAYVHTCECCGRRHEIPKETVCVKPDHPTLYWFDEIPKEKM